MRIRTIKPEFFNHEGLYDAEKETGLPLRVAFPGLWCASDREGRFDWRPRRLKVLILPYDEVDFSRVLDALATRGFIRKYEVDGNEYGVISGFTTHQVINNKERASIIPEPPKINGSNACPTRAPRVDDACHKEGKGKEQGREREKDAPAPSLPDVKSTGRRIPDHQEIISQINALVPSWKKPAQWSAAEMHAFHGSASQFYELEPADWKLLADYFKADLPQGPGFWKPNSRSRFIESLSDVFGHAQRWAEKKGRTMNDPVSLKHAKGL